MMSSDKKWAVILIYSIVISAINTSASILPLVHNEEHHQPAPHLPDPYDHVPHPSHPVSPIHEKGHHHEQHPLPLSHDPHKHDHHHYKDPYVRKHNIINPPPKVLLHEVSNIAIIEKARPSNSAQSIKMDDPYLVAYKSGPPYLKKDLIQLMDNIHTNHNYNTKLIDTKHTLDPPNLSLLNEISLLSHVENPRTMKSIPLVLKNPHAFKDYIGKQNILNPPPENLIHNIYLHK